MYIHPYVPVSANLYQYAWNSPLKYADPMGRDVEESEWERYLELGLTGYVKYGYHMITDYMPDELMLVSGAMNPLVMTGTMAEAQVNGRWDELDYLLIKNNRSYSHGYTEGFWDFTLGNLEGLVTKPVDDVYRMSSYVGDVFSGRNTDNWLMTGVKLISMPMQFASGIPIYDSLDRADEDIEKAKNVAKTVWRVAQMNPVEQAEATLRAGAAIYNHYNTVFHSEEGVAQLFYKGGYGVGAVTGIAADVIVGNAVAKELMQIGGEFGGKLRGIQNVDDVPAASSNSSFADDVTDILKQEGISLDEFNKLRLKDVSTLTDAEKTTLKAIRERVPMPDTDTLMQKVIPASDIEKYIDGTYTQVGGYVTRAEDVAQLSTYSDLYDSLRLDYPESVYNPMLDDSLGVIRYTTDEVLKISIPYGTEMGGVVNDVSPFTGNGFTKATNGQIIPEFKCDGYLEVTDGAQLLEIGKDGTETLRAVYSETTGKFVPVE